MASADSANEAQSQGKYLPLAGKPQSPPGILLILAQNLPMVFPLPVAAYRFANKGVALPGSRERTGSAFVAEKGIMDATPGFDQPRVNDFLEKKLILVMCAWGKKILEHCFDISKQTALAAPHAAHYGHAMVWVVAHNVPCKATALPFVNSSLLAWGEPGISIAHNNALNILICQSPKSPEHAAVVVDAAHPYYLCASLLQAGCDIIGHTVTTVKTRDPSGINLRGLQRIDNRALGVFGVIAPKRIGNEFFQANLAE